MYYVEIRPTVRRIGKPRLVPLSEVYNFRGFRSVFAFDEMIKDRITASGTTSNLRGTDVYADTLFFDFDDHDPVDFRIYLSNSGLRYSEWTSGGRSVHFHVCLEPIFGFWVPAACKAWTKRLAPTADTSFLHPTGMYRLPYTFHAKHAGRRKELVYSQDGAPLVLTEPIDKPRINLEPITTSDQFYFLLTANKRPGNRSTHIWLLATTAAECGMAIDEALNNIRFWNAQQSLPQTDTVVIQQTNNAYLRTQRNSK
jgi:hypothetical protein